MKAWYLPAWNGDFRLEAGDGKTSKLLIMKPTLNELKLLSAFMTTARKRKWSTEELDVDDEIDTRTIVLNAPLDKTGPILVKATKPKDRTLTAIVFRDGQLEVAETGSLETLVAKAANDDQAKAVSVARPTPSCPDCVPGAIHPASEVLLSFLNEQEHADWAQHRAITVIGGRSGHRYLLAHRHSRAAILNHKICYDADDRFVLHFHDWTVPPEEEVLAAKLILEHREEWLRNEATVLQQERRSGKWSDLGFMRYKNPFGDASDGRGDAALTMYLGRLAIGMHKLAKAVG